MKQLDWFMKKKETQNDLKIDTNKRKMIQKDTKQPHGDFMNPGLDDPRLVNPGLILQMFLW